MAKKQEERLICNACGGLIYDGTDAVLLIDGLYDGKFCHADLRDCIRHLATLAESDPEG